MNTEYLTLGFVLTLLLPFASAMKSYQIPAMYVFGDSLVDSGNNKYLPRPSNAKFLPYGIDFGGKPTGRCTNGKTVVDYFAIHLGLPFAPPYLGLSNLQRDRIITGINYASAGSGILPGTNNGTVVLDTQIKFFQRTVQNNLPKLLNDQARLKKHLSESLFVVSTGVNDNFHNGTFLGSSKFASYLLKEFSLRLQKMYNLGARKFFVNNIAPAGCFPSQAVRSRPRGKCDEKINRGLSFYNKGLPNVLYELQSKFPGFTFILSDLYKFLIEMRETANRYGIRETWKPCCPNKLHGDLICRPGVTFCPDRNIYLWFDDHPSQITNQIYVKRCFSDPTTCKPSGLKMFYYAYDV